MHLCYESSVNAYTNSEQEIRYGQKFKPLFFLSKSDQDSILKSRGPPPSKSQAD